MCCGWQHDVMRLDAGEFFEHGARGVTKTGALLPHLQALPQHESEKAHEDMGLQTIGALMPDRPHVQLVLLDAKGSFGLRELDVSLPQLLVAPIGNVGTQEVGALGERGPVVEHSIAGDLKWEP